MTKEEIFATWAPETSLWSRWAKPVLFAHLNSAARPAPKPEPPLDLGWIAPASEMAALVVDLPGAKGVSVALVLAVRGYRPVPLYNAVPAPAEGLLSGPSGAAGIAAVDLSPVMAELVRGAERLAQLRIPSGAPPVFLLDANRHGLRRQMQPGAFDNRSICFTTDFPSANFLLAHGIKRAVLVQESTLVPQPDVAHILRRWQDGGLALERAQLDLPIRPVPFQVARPSWYGAMFQRALAAFGLHRAAGGGFGAWMRGMPSGG